MESSAPHDRLSEGALLATSPQVCHWLDITCSVFGHTEALSVLGADILRRALTHFSHAAFGRGWPMSRERAVVDVVDGRVWLNLSVVAGWVRVDALSRWLRDVDPLAAATLRTPGHPLVPAEDVVGIDLFPGLVVRGARALTAAVSGQLQPARARAQVDAAWKSWWGTIQRRSARPVTADNLVEWVDDLLEPTATFVLDALLPRIALATTASRVLRELGDGRPETLALSEAIPRGVEGGATTAWMRALATMAARSSAPSAHADAEGTPTDEFWEAFAHRGPRELDVATPRFGETPDVLTQWADVLRSRPSLVAAWDHAAQTRKLAASTLAADLHRPLDRARFWAAVDVVEHLGGLGDLPVAALVQALWPIRRALMTLAGERMHDVPLTLEPLRSMPLAGVAAWLAGHDSVPTPALRLAGASWPAVSPSASGSVVGGTGEGPLWRPRFGQAPPSVFVLVTDGLSLSDAPWAASAAAVVVVGDAGLGAALPIVRGWGIPCVVAPAVRTWPEGQWVSVDGTQGIVCIAQHEH